MSVPQAQQPDLRVTVTTKGEITAARWNPCLMRNNNPSTGQNRVPRLAGLFDVTIERSEADDITIATDLVVDEVLQFVGPKAARTGG